MACAQVLERCIFCGASDTTEEHLVADWVFRAFARSRNPGPFLSGTLLGDGQMRVGTDEPISTAKVVCGPCNNGWMSQIDNAAAEVLRPLVRGKDVVTLTPSAQIAVSAWLFKSALTFDAAQAGNAGRLSGLRTGFAATRSAPSSCTIYAGPTPLTPFTIDGIPEVAGLLLFGVRETSGPVNVTLNIQAPDGTVESSNQYAMRARGYTVMLGNLQAIISLRRAPVVPTADQGFACIWPAAEDLVTVTSAPPSSDGV